MILIFDNRGRLTLRSKRPITYYVTDRFNRWWNHLLWVVQVLLFLDSECPCGRYILRWCLLLVFLHFLPWILIFFERCDDSPLNWRLIFRWRIMRLRYVLQGVVDFRILLQGKIVLIISRTSLDTFFYVILCLCLSHLSSAVFVVFIVLVFFLHLNLFPQLLLHILIFLYHALIFPEALTEYLPHVFEHLRC